MPTRFDPYTGEPLDLAPETRRPDEDVEDSLVISGEQRQHGTILHGDAQQENRFGMAVAVPLVIVALIAPAAVGLLSIALASRGTLALEARGLVPALILGGSFGAVIGVAGAFWSWRASTVQGPLRTVATGALASLLAVGLFAIALGLVFG